MVSCEKFYTSLISNDISFFAGVPDSLLKDICAYITTNSPKEKHIITPNEGNAVAVCAGHYLSTGKIGLTYMQNSGQGNTINPLASLMDDDVYSIPTLLLIGWRGEPGVKDEPQHVKQGKITLDLLDVLGIPYKVLDEHFEDSIKKAKEYMCEHKKPYALIVKKKYFDSYTLEKDEADTLELTREGALRSVLEKTQKKDIIISTTGKTSRELFELREEFGQTHERDFLTVGSMGHASSIAMGIANNKPYRTIYCIDGDGACLMHMGMLGLVGQSELKNFRHIVINNGAHDSVGGQPTIGFGVDFCKIALACGYKSAHKVVNRDEIHLALENISEGPSFVEIHVRKGARKDLGRPTTTPKENKDAFMQFVKE